MAEHVKILQFVLYPSDQITTSTKNIMRPDMHKVIVERPRSNPGPNKGNRRANLPDEFLPKFEGIKRPHHHRKGQRDLFGPLRRWLHSQVGRPWNDVYSEACAVIDPGDYVRIHVKTHLLEFVERNTFMHDGKVCVLDVQWTGEPLPLEGRRRRRNLFFVHPTTGLLHASPQESLRVWRARQPKPVETVRWIGRGIGLQQIRGLWFECHFKAVSEDFRFGGYDHALERVVAREEITKFRREYLHCFGKRQLSRRELKQHGLKNSVVDVDGAQCSSRLNGGLKTALILAGRRLRVILNPAEAVRFRRTEQSALV